MRARAREVAIPVLMLVAIAATALATRPLIPIDETRYASVAWEMYTTGDYLVPHVNGVPYSHKPPLLFWLVCLGWAAFGVSEWWLQLLPALTTLGTLLLAAAVARKLWPDAPRVWRLAPLLLMGTMAWLTYSTAVMFDMLLALFALAGVLGLLRVALDGRRSGWVLVGAALGLGILAKGPVMLLYVLPVALLAPWWLGERRPVPVRTWYLGLAGALLLGVGIALTWVVPAAIAGGPAYREAILWKQTAGRVASAFTHRRGPFYYLPLLPLLSFPWAFWPPLWRTVRSGTRVLQDLGVRLGIAWFVPAFVAFSLLSSKQMHYLVPVLPALALVGAAALGTRGQAPRRWDGLAVAAVYAAVGAALVAVSAGWAPVTMPHWAKDIPPAAGLAVLASGLLLLTPLARRLDAGVTPLALAGVAFFVAIHLGPVRLARADFDMRDVGAYLKESQDRGVPLAHIGGYDGQFHFAGRLASPIEVVPIGKLRAWAALHPDGCVVGYPGVKSRSVSAQPELVHDYQWSSVAVWRSDAVQTAETKVSALSGPNPQSIH